MNSLNDIGKEFVELTGVDIGVEQGLARAQEELAEALAADSDEELALEMADVVLTLAACAAMWELDLDAAIAKKHLINMAREWAPHPTIPGAVQHVKKVTR